MKKYFVKYLIISRALVTSEHITENNKIPIECLQNWSKFDKRRRRCWPNRCPAHYSFDVKMLN